MSADGVLKGWSLYRTGDGGQGLKTQREGQDHQRGHIEGQGQIQGTEVGVRSVTALAAASQANQVQGQDPEVRKEDLSPQEL